MISTLKQVREALQDLKRQYGEHPDAFWDWTKGRAAITKLDALIAQVEKAEPRAAECKFESDETWGSCAIAHHNLVQSEPHKWPGYQTRLLYTAPQRAAVQPQQEPIRTAELVASMQEATAIMDKVLDITKSNIQRLEERHAVLLKLKDRSKNMNDKTMCEYCSTPLPLGVDKPMRQFRSHHFDTCLVKKNCEIEILQRKWDEWKDSLTSVMEQRNQLIDALVELRKLSDGRDIYMGSPPIRSLDEKRINIIDNALKQWTKHV